MKIRRERRLGSETETPGNSALNCMVNYLVGGMSEENKMKSAPLNWLNTESLGQADGTSSNRMG